ncbi:hypothetical protein [Pseudoduganella sp. OTU4001]|uniref:hypothetical protein n=1 Tax=Pseudoduganella sp. OTU4001 TaxID=3043854 RepID=UPI00313C9E09
MSSAGVRSGPAARRPVLVALLCGALLPAMAAAAPWAAVVPVGALSDAATAAAAPQPAATASPAARDEKLEQMRGGTDTPWSDMKLAGSVANNSAVNVVTGANIVTESAFSNASGLPMVIQNSGANVLIQNATIINVQVK